MVAPDGDNSPADVGQETLEHLLAIARERTVLVDLARERRAIDRAESLRSGGIAGIWHERHGRDCAWRRRQRARRLGDRQVHQRDRRREAPHQTRGAEHGTADRQQAQKPRHAMDRPAARILELNRWQRYETRRPAAKFHWTGHCTKILETWTQES